MSIFPNKEICLKYPLKINFYYNQIIKNMEKTYYLEYKKEKDPGENTSLFSKETFTPNVNPNSYKKFEKKMPLEKKTSVGKKIIPEAKPLTIKNKLILSEINSLLSNDYEEATKISAEYDNYKPNNNT